MSTVFHVYLDCEAALRAGRITVAELRQQSEALKHAADVLSSKDLG